MRRFLTGRAVIQATTLTSSPAKQDASLVRSKAKRRLQAWHYLIPVFTVFGIVFGVVLVTSDFLFLTFSALAVVVLFSVVIIALARAWCNDY